MPTKKSKKIFSSIAEKVKWESIEGTAEHSLDSYDMFPLVLRTSYVLRSYFPDIKIVHGEDGRGLKAQINHPQYGKGTLELNGVHISHVIELLESGFVSDLLSDYKHGLVYQSVDRVPRVPGVRARISSDCIHRIEVEMWPANKENKRLMEELIGDLQSL